MKRCSIVVGTTFTVFLMSLFIPYAATATPTLEPVEPQQQQEEDYEKWGKIAVLVAQQAYPDQSITDYVYEGREDLEDNLAQDSFRLTVEENGEEKEVMIHVVFNKETEQLNSVNIEEVEA